MAHGCYHNGGEERHGGKGRGVHRSEGGDTLREVRFDEDGHEHIGDGDAGEGHNRKDNEPGSTAHESADDKPQTEGNHSDQHGDVQPTPAGQHGGNEAHQGEDEGGEAGEETSHGV